MKWINFKEHDEFILRKFLHTKEKSIAHYCVIDDDNHHCNRIWQ
jgi:hypothetical protein